MACIELTSSRALSSAARSIGFKSTHASRKAKKKASIELMALTRYPEKDAQDIVGKEVAVTDSAWSLVEGEFVWAPAAAGAFPYQTLKGTVTGDYYLDDFTVTKVAEHASLPGAKLESLAYDFEKGDKRGWGQRVP